MQGSNSSLLRVLHQGFFFAIVLMSLEVLGHVKES